MIGVGITSPAHALDVYGDCIAFQGTCINQNGQSNFVSYAAGSFFFSANTTQAINLTRFLGGANTAPATTDVTGYIVPTTGTLSALYVAADANSFTAATSVYTLMKNTVATSMTCTLTAAGLTCNDALHPINVTAGDRISIRVVTSNAGSGSLTRSNASVEFKTTTNVFSSQWITGTSSIYYTGGSVGIGTTTPSSKLHLLGTSNTVQMIVQGNSTQTNHLQEWKDNGGTILSLHRQCRSIL